MPRIVAAVLAIATVVTLGGACARAVQVGTGAGPVYSIDVQNTLALDMIVSYDDGSGARTLGTVQANGQERFIIAAPRDLAIRVTARDASGERTAGPYPVTLVPDQPQVVTIR